MNYQVVTIKIDPVLKKKAQDTALDLGMPLSVIIKGFLKQFVRTRTVTFSAKSNEPSNYLISQMKKAEKNIKSGNHSPSFKDGSKAVKWLEKQGI